MIYSVQGSLFVCLFVCFLAATPQCIPYATSVCVLLGDLVFNGFSLSLFLNGTLKDFFWVSLDQTNQNQHTKLHKTQNPNHLRKPKPKTHVFFVTTPPPPKKKKNEKKKKPQQTSEPQSPQDMPPPNTKAVIYERRANGRGQGVFCLFVCFFKAY